MKKHTLALLGGVGGQLRVPASVLQETLDALLQGARQATRLVVEGQSTKKGPRPTWLDAACDIQITGLSAGSAVLALEAPTLEEAAPARFGTNRQAALFDGSRETIGKYTPVELFGEVLANVVADELGDVVADRPLLDTCLRFARAGGDSFEAIQLNGLSTQAAGITLERKHIPRIEQLRDATPHPQAVRLTGTLDTISASRPHLILRLSDGKSIRARVAEHDPEALRALFGKKVVVSGIAHFRPGGRVLLLQVESIAPAGERDELFEGMPVARSSRPVAERLFQDENTGVSAFFGTWPGHETDDELLDALRRIE